LKNKAWIKKQPDVFLADDEGAREVFDFSAISDEQESLFLHSGSKSRWLITTSVAGIAGALVIGAALIGTFGFGGIEGPAVAAQYSASLWQRSSISRKGDRASGVTGVIGRSQVAEIVAERSYKKHSVTFARAQSRTKTRKQPGATTGLVGSLAPDYPIKTGFTGGANGLDGKPAVVGGTGLKMAALTPGGTVNTTKIAKTSPVSHSERLEETIEVEKGDTLLKLLTERGTPKDKTIRIIKALNKVFPERRLQEGHKIHITYDNVTDKAGYETLRPIRVAVVTDPDNPDKIVAAALGKNGKYQSVGKGVKAAAFAKHNNSDRVRARARIRKSLYFAAKEQGIPERVIVEIMRVHAYDVDFQRQVRPGDSFDVFYHVPNGGLRRGRRGRRGVVLYSALTLQNKTRGYYRYTTPDDGITDYYDASGRSATKFLMRTPVIGARITSGFGLRRHPILKVTKMHTGVDFAAPRGTPVKAAGHGIIEKIGRFGAYGKYIRIRHANGYKTAYAHMHRYRSGLREGMKIQQDEVIGYIGSTGRSTANHLHYEIIVNDRHVNPMKLRMPTGRRLRGTTLAAFKKEIRRIDQLMRAAPVSTRLASARN
jgi:murein DD-endopeptidase MepM/ murein hydrolase activator NlpD